MTCKHAFFKSDFIANSLDKILIFMSAKFGSEKEYFSNLLKNLSFNIEDEKIDKARNLLYVATTRSMLNLSILYSDDITGFEDSIEAVFGKIIKNMA